MKNRLRKLFQKEVRVISEFEVGHVSLILNNNEIMCSLGGTARSSEMKWVDREWLRRLKRWFRV